ncbi:unnamed protein product [Callosobruchus maculatus]|uniref:DUF7869 domain-containing protein n=1 Tax=Callosobruchus maculatus TaxID=64391 RepID=A0A653DV01_CALMS|nr:unnamed protein product [Callosobruchus maculatus]
MSGHRARMMLQLIAEQTNNFSGGLISEVAAEEQNIDEFCCDNDSSSIQEAERDKPLDTLESEREIDSLCQSNQNIESDVINEIGYASNQEVASHTKVNVENNPYDPHDDTNANNCAGSSSQKLPIIDDKYVESSDTDSPLDDTTDDPDYSSYESSSTISDNASKINKKRTIKNPCPPPEKQVRKRKRAPQKWQKNLTKKLRDSGLAYTSVKVTKKSDGSKERELVSREEKKILPACSSEKCRLKCSTKISDEQRHTIFNEYWAMADLHRQQMFIASCISSIKPRYRYLNATTKFRGTNNAYFFKLRDENVRVCKQFFMATLSINSRIIRTVIEKRSDSVGPIVEPEKRGKHENHKKVCEEIKNGVRDHIKGIPRIESHYCRSGTKREYIEGGKSVADLHRDYVELCTDLNKPFVNYLMYFNIFKEEFNISFHVPKKDQCDFCVGFHNSIDEEKKNLQTEYDLHIEEKELSRQEKEKDKRSVDKVTAVFDLQAALPCPQADSSKFYYVSKLNTYNLTIYELQSTETNCFIWHEGHGNRGANEIGSCLWHYLVDLNENKSEKIDIIFYSDNCAGQNKNKFIFALYIYAVLSLENINSITHKFLITGHTQNEGDHVHSVIEGAIKKFKKSSPIYVPDHYVTIIKQAKKRGKPYRVHEMSFSNFFDLKLMAQEIGIKDVFKNEDGEIVQLSKICAVKVTKDNPEELFYKTSFKENDFRSLVVTKSKRQCMLSKAIQS